MNLCNFKYLAKSGCALRGISGAGILPSMSITAPDDRISTYNPVVATTEFAAQFPVFDNDDIAVYHDGVERTDFTISATYISGVANDARAVFSVGITGNVRVVGRRDPRRTNQFQSGGPLPIRDFNLALNTLTAEAQEARRDLDRSFKAPYGTTAPGVPQPEDQRVLGWIGEELQNLDPAQFVNMAGVATAEQGANADTALQPPSPVYSGIARNKAGSWPEPKNKIVTTASHTSGSPNITVADGSLVNNGDSIVATFLPYQTWVTSGGGTNNLVLSKNANATGVGTTVTIGHDRWDLTSTTVGDTAGFRRLYIGETAKGRSTMSNQINGQGLDYQQVTAFSCENEYGGVSGWFGNRMSKEATGLSGIIALATYTLIDEDPINRHAWNRYEQANLKVGTAPTGAAQFIQVESSLESYWPTVDINPFSYNNAGSTRIYRLDPGIGQYAERGEPAPNNISAMMDFVNNGATARAGLVFGSTALDTEGGTRQAPVLAMAPHHALTWYGSDNNEAWSIFSDSTAADGYIWLQDTIAKVGNANIGVTKPAGQSKIVQFMTDQLARFSVGITATAEAGSNAGSDFAISRFNDAGSFVAVAFQIRRSNGRLAMPELAASASYASDAAAAAGGVGVGELYRNGSQLMIRIT